MTRVRQMNPIELVAVVMTLVGIVLTIREWISCWQVAHAGKHGLLTAFCLGIEDARFRPNEENLALKP